MAIRKESLQHRQERRSSASSAFGGSVSVASEYDDNASSTYSVGGTDELGLYDVICGRHKAAFNNIGNRRFRVTVSLAQERYTTASTRKDKSAVIKSIVDLVRSNGGRFLQRQDGTWVELNDKQAHEKAGHALRDMAVSNAMKTESYGNRSPKSIAKAAKSMRPADSLLTAAASHLLLPVEKPCDTATTNMTCSDSRNGAAWAASKAANVEENIDVEDIEPIPWLPDDKHQPMYEQPVAFDSMVLSWLSKESDSIIQRFA